MAFNKRYAFQVVCVCFFLLSCGQEPVHIEASKSQELDFIEPDQENFRSSEILKQSKEFYKGSPQCSSKRDCQQICRTLFLSSSSQAQCSKLNARQVYQIQNLYEKILTQDLEELKKISPFDLKVFFSLSSESFFEFLKTVKPNSIKAFLIWIAEDWKIATVFQEEDYYYLYMQIFLNELNYFPIQSLKESLKEGKTFVEISWIKQNDTALVWLNGYLENVHCQLDNDKENCLLEAYCMLYDSWDSNILMEIQSSDILYPFLGANHLEGFCSERCSSQNCQEGV